MTRVILKRVFIPTNADTDEKIRILEGHINDLENSLEAILDLMNSKISKEAEENVS